MTTETINGKQYLKDAQGRMVPVDTIRPEALLENELVLKLVRDAEALSASLAAFKTLGFSETDALMELLLSKYSVRKGGKKGNVTFVSIDGMVKVQVSCADFLTFGPELQVAKTLIDECIKDWGSGQNDRIIALVNHAFRVDKEGRVNKDDILSLRKIDIRDEKWLRAMEAISNSVRVSRTKRYIRVYRRASEEQDFEPIPLDLARVP